LRGEATGDNRESGCSAGLSDKSGRMENGNRIFSIPHLIQAEEMHNTNGEKAF
jgi:hypothetical protein